MQIKNPATYDQQVKALQKKQIIVNDPDACKAFLHRVNYYRISGYYLPYLNKTTNTCFRPTPLQRIIGSYEFDAALRSLLMSIIESIEVALKSEFSYYHAHLYGSEGYMDAKNYNAKHDHERFQALIEQCAKEHATSPVVRHHIKQYGGHFPIWVMIDFFSTGMLSYFFADLPNRDKSHLASSLYGVSYQTLESWLRCLTDLRNKCAHASRLYYWIFSAIPKMPPKETYKPTTRLFAQLYMLKMMYPDQQNWNSNFAEPLCELINKYSRSILLKHMDFPQDWKELLYV